MAVLVIAREQAALDRVLPLLRRGGIDAASTTSDDVSAETVSSPLAPRLRRANPPVLGVCRPRQACAAQHGVNAKRPLPRGTRRRWPRTSAIGSVRCKNPIPSMLGI